MQFTEHILKRIVLTKWTNKSTEMDFMALFMSSTRLKVNSFSLFHFQGCIIQIDWNTYVYCSLCPVPMLSFSAFLEYQLPNANFKLFFHFDLEQMVQIRNTNLSWRHEITSYLIWTLNHYLNNMRIEMCISCSYRVLFQIFSFKNSSILFSFHWPRSYTVNCLRRQCGDNSHLYKQKFKMDIKQWMKKRKRACGNKFISKNVHWHVVNE